MWPTDTAWLPRWRFSLLSLVAITSIATLLASIATLAYQLRFTVGYNKPIPALCVASTLAAVHSSLFLSPTTTSSTKRRRTILALQTELVSLLVLVLLTLATVARLHSSTPGLFSACGGYFICVSLQSDVALAWILFFFLTLLFVPLLLATVYHLRRTKSTEILREPFVLFNWRVYSPRGRGTRGTGEGGILGRTSEQPNVGPAE